MLNWAEIKQQCGEDAQGLIDSLNLGWLFDSNENPGDEDKAVAWEVYVELRTRITTQPLHFLDGDEATALTSVFNLFAPSRELLKKDGRKGHRTSAFIEAVLNHVIRPFTAKWHRRKLAGDLARDDATREFRAELQQLRPRLEQVGRVLHAIACGEFPAEDTTEAQEDQPAPSPSILFDRLLGFPQTELWQKQTDAIRAKERQEVVSRREAVRGKAEADGDGAILPTGSDDLVGLAVSGGGIRSATFALGVVQGLADRGVLRQVDLMSTVSGGGYLGAFLSSILNTQPPPEGEQETTPTCSPHRNMPPFRSDIAGDSRAIRELRNNSRYILPSSFGRWLLTIGQAAYGVVSNLIILGVLVFVAVLLTACYEDRTGTLSDLYSRVRAEPQPRGPSHEVLSMSDQPIALWGVSVGLLFFLPVVQRIGRRGRIRAEFCRWWELTTVGAFAIALVATAVEYLPLAHYGYLTWMHAVGDWMRGEGTGSGETIGGGWSLRATVISLVNAIGFIAARSEWLRQLGKSYPRLHKLLFGLLWMAGPALLVYAYFELSRVYVADSTGVIFAVKGIEVTATRLLGGLLLLSLGYAAFVNVNFTSLHRYYRNRLAETYLLRQQGSSVERVDPQPLSVLRATSCSTAPYHLINAALNLPSSNVPELRGRDCDFFLFSKHFCGSLVLGYTSTGQWENEDPHLDLGTAVAISGAAAAPQMGMGSIRGASFLLTMLNVRLGYWLRRPASGCCGKLIDKLRLNRLAAPGPTYLMREAFNRMDHRRWFLGREYAAPYVNLSDGGHIENLGIYELLRRRCKYIIAIDGECDPNLDCPSLMRLQHFASVDLGVDIEMDVDRLKWVEVIPTDAKPRDDEQGAAAVVRAVKERMHYSR